MHNKLTARLYFALLAAGTATGCDMAGKATLVNNTAVIPGALEPNAGISVPSGLPGAIGVDVAGQMITELQANLIGHGLTEAQAAVITAGAQKEYNEVAGQVAIEGLSLLASKRVVATAPPAIVKGALAATSDPSAGLPADAQRAAIVGVVVNSAVSSLGGKTEGVEKTDVQAIQKDVVAAAVTALPAAQLTGDGAPKALEAITSGAVAALPKSGNDTASVAAAAAELSKIAVQTLPAAQVSPAQTAASVLAAANGTVSSLGAAGLPAEQVGDAAAGVAKASVGGLKELNLSDAQLLDATQGIANGAVSGLVQAGVSTANAGKAAASIAGGTTAGLAEAGVPTDKVESFAGPVASGAIQGLATAGLTGQQIVDSKAVSQIISGSASGAVAAGASTADLPSLMGKVSGASVAALGSIGLDTLELKNAAVADVVAGSSNAVQKIVHEIAALFDQLANILAYSMLSVSKESVMALPKAGYTADNAASATSAVVKAGIAELATASSNGATSASDAISISIKITEGALAGAATLAANDSTFAVTTKATAVAAMSGAMDALSTLHTAGVVSSDNDISSFTGGVAKGTMTGLAYGGASASVVSGVQSEVSAAANNQEALTRLGVSAEAKQQIGAQVSSSTDAAVTVANAVKAGFPQCASAFSDSLADAEFWTKADGVASPVICSAAITACPKTRASGGRQAAWRPAAISGACELTLSTVVVQVVASPVFSVAAGTYPAGQAVAITTETKGATILYTIDGSSPSGGKGIAYAGPVALSGALTLKAVAFRSGWTTSTETSGAYVVTYPPPKIAISTPAAGAVISTVSNVVMVAVSGACGSYGNSTVALKVDGAAVGSSTPCANGAFSTNIDGRVFADGVHALTAAISDSYGQTVVSPVVSIRKDTVAPAIVIVSGANASAANQAALSLSGTCAGAEDGRTVTFFANGVAIATSPNTILCNSGAWTANVNLSAVADGAVTLGADVSDAAGNAATRATKVIMKDVAAPVVTISSPGVIVNSANQSAFTLSGTCVGAENGRTVTVRAGGTAMATSPTPLTCANQAWSAQVDVSMLGDGPIAFSADLSDAAGNAATPAARIVMKDATAPAVTIATPGGPIDAANAAAFSLSGSCAGAENGQVLTLTADGNAFATSPATITCNGGNWSAEGDFHAFANGTIVVGAAVSDAAGNAATPAAQSVTKNVIAPSAPSAIVFAGNANKNDAAPLFKVDGIQSGDVATIFDGGACSGAALGAATAGGTSVVVEATGLTPGAHTISTKIMRNGIASACATPQVIYRVCDPAGSPLGGGAGTVGDPYKICTPTHMSELMNYSASGATLSAHYRLAADIDMTPLSGAGAMIAYGAQFTGVFDGDGYSLNNFSASATNGLFQTTDNATIKNLTLHAVKVSGTANIGTLVGVAANNTIISNCSADGTVTCSQQSCGGLVGVVNSATITGSSAAVDVVANMVDSTGIGGLVGFFNLGAGTISQSFASGSVMGFSRLGGLVGVADGGSPGAFIVDSYATGTVTMRDIGNKAGGLVGMLIHRNASQGMGILNSYAAGSLVGTYQTGGLVGYTEVQAGATPAFFSSGSFWDKQFSTQPTDQSTASGITTAEMKQASVYTGAGWSGSVWSIADGLLPTFNFACASDADCGAGVCGSDGKGGGVCVRTKVSTGAGCFVDRECVRGYSCNNNGSNTGFAACSAINAGFANKGGACNNDNQCSKGHYCAVSQCAPGNGAPVRPSGVVAAKNPNRNDALPIITVSGVLAGDTVEIFSNDAGCTGAPIGTATSAGTVATVVPGVALGAVHHEIYARSVRGGVPSACSTAFDVYDVCNPAATPFGGGDGTVRYPYKLCAPAHMATLMDHTPNAARMAASYLLTADIDLTSLSGAGAMIAYGQNFSGVFDGDGYSLNNFSTSAANGLFQTTDHATIKNLNLHNAAVSGTNYVGALIGNSQNGTTITNCHADGTVTCTGYSCGGLVGVQSGGLTARSSAAVAVSANMTNATGIGGLIGFASIGDTAVIQSFATGSVTGFAQIGGLIGIADGGSEGPVVIESYATGTVTMSSGGNRSAGLVGFFIHRNASASSTGVLNSYAAAPVIYSYQSGGLIGYSEVQASGGTAFNAVNSFWDLGVSGRSTDWSVATGLTTAQMQVASSYPASWSPDVWNLQNGSYPQLKTACTGNSDCSGGSLLTGLVGLWHLNDAPGAPIADASGYGYDGVIFGDVKVGAWGNVENAASFDGATGFVNLSDGSMPAGNAPRTVSLWVMPTTTTSGVMFEYGDVAGSAGFGIGFAGGRFTHFGGTMDYVSNAMPAANLWHHVVVTVDGTGSKLYVNGVLDQVTAQTWATSPTGTLRFGARLDNSAKLQARMREVGVWNRVLSDTEVKALYVTKRIRY